MSRVSDFAGVNGHYWLRGPEAFSSEGLCALLCYKSELMIPFLLSILRPSDRSSRASTAPPPSRRSLLSMDNSAGRWCGRHWSDLLLYGGTANVAVAIAAGVRLGIGLGWSPLW